MKKTSTTKVTLNPNSPISGDTQWDQIDAKSDKEILNASKSDPENPPLTNQELSELRPMYVKVPGQI